jgi:uroporphyrinogen-III synthase
MRKKESLSRFAIFDSPAFYLRRITCSFGIANEVLATIEPENVVFQNFAKMSPAITPAHNAIPIVLPRAILSKKLRFLVLCRYHHKPTQIPADPPATVIQKKRRSGTRQPRRFARSLSSRTVRNAAPLATTKPSKKTTHNPRCNTMAGCISPTIARASQSFGFRKKSEEPHLFPCRLRWVS